MQIRFKNVKNYQLSCQHQDFKKPIFFPSKKHALISLPKCFSTKIIMQLKNLDSCENYGNTTNYSRTLPSPQEF